MSSLPSLKQDNHPEDTKNPTTTLDKTAVEAVAASSGARYDVERPEEKDHIQVVEDFCKNISTQLNQVAVFSEKISNAGVWKCIEPPLVGGDKLPCGSFGEVSLHVDPVTNHRIARKKVKCPSKFSKDEALIPKMMGRDCWEGSLRDSFVEILGLVQVNGTLFLLMTAVDVDLIALIKKDWWRNITYGEPLVKVRHILRQILLALQWMHEKGYGHLDIKPENVGFKFSYKQAVLLDFGTAREFDDGEDFSTHNGMTYFYMAPELYQFVLSKKADIYATACLVYFLIYKKPMWPDESIATKSIFDFFKELTLQQIYQKIPRDLHKGLRDLLIDMFHPDANYRLSAAEALEYALFTQFCITDSFTMHTLLHPPEMHTAPESTADNGWAEAEPPCLLELLSGDEGEDEGEDEGDQDRGDDCRTSNTDELAVPGQRWAEAESPCLSELMSGDVQETGDTPEDRHTSNTDGLSVAGQRWAEAESLCLSELMSGDVQEMGDTPEDRHTSNTDGLSVAGQRWAEAESLCLSELMSGDVQEMGDTPEDRHTSNTDGLSVAGQRWAEAESLCLSELMSGDVQERETHLRIATLATRMGCLWLGRDGQKQSHCVSQNSCLEMSRKRETHLRIATLATRMGCLWLGR
ncbi:Mitogen-activated protein kinase kinase kinase 3 [Lamellibrachia satsuma]|nr:Mitogen-activated protein kinase kinase kinase 3 [Lamellibrachia satsuma]